MMTGLTALWMPILASSVLVFVASSIIHMLLPAWHKDDCRKVPDEEKFRDAVRPLAIPPGDYAVPRPDTMADMKTSEFAEKMNRGPVVIFTVVANGPMSMRKSLVQWFVYCVVVGVLAAYVAGASIPPGAAYLRVFQITGATAFIAYSAALWQFSIWYHRDWGTTIRSTVDGLIYALLTAGVFGWLWPN
jgi:hypothetical protein